MGFSLQAFFNELLTIIDTNGTDKEKYNALMKAVLEGEEYAKQCGEI